MSATAWTSPKATAAIVAGLALITLAVYLPMLRDGFVNYDDPEYIIGNAHVTAGLTWPGIVWAFRTGTAANWHPLTWISHMADCQLYGLRPWGHHLTNLLLHTANTVLLFLLLQRTTGSRWRSAFVAALFAVHPLHVESVAWASERKDILSAFFWMLTLLAYVRFVEESGVPGSKSTVFYGLALVMFACGLMCKPMVVTLPFVLLLLDFWPLRRCSLFAFRLRPFLRLLLERAPFFALTAASCIITLHVQEGARWSSAALPFDFRLANALMSYLRYISKTFWPTDLALIYPYPHNWPWKGVIAAALVLVLLSVIFLVQARRFPYLAVGWFWFLGMLVPTIGLVQVGVQSMADRYTYLPDIGLFILVVWGLNDLLASQPHRKIIAAAIGSVALAACLAVTTVQLHYWRNSLSLFLHTLRVTANNYAAYDCLGKSLDEIGRTHEAADMYAQCVETEPDYPMGQFDLGMALLEQDKPDAASNHLATAVQLEPHNPVMQFDFGVFLAQHGRPDAAAAHFQAALADQPDFPEALHQLEQLRTNTPANRSTP